jgi:pimeloyl-ACP methyl ester carboxylesterase
MVNMRSSQPAPSTRQGFTTTDDGLEVYWRVHGEGAPAIVCCNGIGVSTFFWEYLVRHFAPSRAVVVWDYRGHGRSSPVTADSDVSIQQHARDLGAVVEELGLDRPVLAGHSMGAQVILERYRQNPDGVGGLVTVLGTYGNPLDTFQDLSFSRQLFDVVLQLTDSFPALMDIGGKLAVAVPLAYGLGKRLKWIDGSRLSRHDLRQYLHHLTAMGFPLFFRMVCEMGEHSAKDLLPEVNVPVLVVAAEFDAFTPPRLSVALDEALPDSEIVWLEGASHAGIVEQPEKINAALETYLRERVEPLR